MGQIGIIGHDRVMVSLAKPHYTNQGIKATRALSINIVDEAMLPNPDRQDFFRCGVITVVCFDQAQTVSYQWRNVLAWRPAMARRILMASDNRKFQRKSVL